MKRSEAALAGAWKRIFASAVALAGSSQAELAPDEPSRASGLVPSEESTVPATPPEPATTPLPTESPRAPETGSPRIVAPVAHNTPVDYPDGATGSDVVLLELLVTRDGTVQDAQVIIGKKPFGEAAWTAALTWSFTPASVNGKPVSARIRFEVNFEPPIEIEEPVAPTEQPEPPEEASTPTATVAPIQEVLVQGERSEGERKISRAEVRQLPGTFGDAFRAVEILPGVTPIVSGLPYFYVRGAPPGNVGYFLDGVRVPLLFHIGAGPSVIHPAFIESVELYAGPYPARYGRFTGGIVAGETAPPEYETRAEASIRILDAGGMVETHALDKDLSVMVAGRYSYFALIGSLLTPDVNISYWDYQGRVQYRIDEKSSVTLFSFGALDKASDGEGEDKIQIFDLTFHRYDLRYDRALEDGGSMRVATTFGTEVSGGETFDLRNRLIGGRFELEKPLSGAFLLRAGLDLQTDHYRPLFDTEDFDVDLADGDTPSEFDDVDSDDDEFDAEDLFPPRLDLSTGIRADLVWKATKDVRVIPGVRFDFFVADKTPFWALSPRLYAEFDINANVTLVHGLGVAHQLPSFFLPLPGVRPVDERGLQRAVQHSSGVRWQFPEGISAEATVFQNIITNLTDGLGTIGFYENDNDLDPRDRSIGSGRGFELLVRRSLSQRLGGFLSYTLSHSRRALGRRTGPSAFDRTHVLGAALGYQIGQGWSVGGRASLYTGIRAQNLGPRFNFSNPPRTRPFYRFDWRVEKRWKIGSEGAWWSLVAEVLNTTLNKEEIALDCSTRPCERERVGPITIPNLGVEASL